MPIKLTSSEYKVIGIAVVVAAVSLGIGVKYFWRAFPEAAIEFRVNRDDSAPVAEKFLAARGARLEGYRHAAVFDYDDESKVYLERTQGLVRMDRLTRGPVHLWRWSHRWFKPQQKEEFRADVTPAGEVLGFNHEIPEAAPGANLEPASARVLAEKFLIQVMKRDLAELEFVETKTDKRPARTDYSFTWKQRSVDLGDGSWRLVVEVNGDQVAGYSEFLKIPEQWSRDYRKLRSRNESAQFLAEVFFFLLTGAMLVILILRVRDRDIPGRMSVAFGGVAAALYFLGQLNTFSVAEFYYRTTDSYASFLARQFLFSFLGALGVGAFIFFLVASSEPVYRENFPRQISIRRYLSWSGLRTRSFLMANVVGIALTFFFFAYQTVFYLVAEKLGAWAPADVPFTDLLNTRIPWVTVLFIGFFPAVSEEMQFRAFAIPFLKKLLRGWPAALVLSSFIWGFLHSAYPNQPFFIRGVEVGLGGIVTGLVMLRFGILATLIWHYSVDALYTAFLLLRSPNHYLMVSGGLAAGIMLIPLVVALVAYWRTRTFADESPLTNASAGISRAPHKEAVAEPEAPLSYRPLANQRLVLAGVLTLVFIALAAVPVERFGEGISLRTSCRDALRAADAFLRQRHIEPASYRRVAWIYDNVQPLAIRYLLERKSIQETDRIYRQATRPALWEARYFRPLQKEEHLVFVDPGSSQVAGYRHLLDDDAPGASLAPDQAQALAAKALEQEGYRLADFDLQNSQAKTQKARQDYTLVWQAKPGDPRNVGDAHYWLEVNVAGDQVVGLRRFFKLPEEWERQRTAVRLSYVILIGVGLVVVVGIVAGGLILLVGRVRRAQIPWRPALKVGAAVAVLWVLAELNGLSAIYREYDTSISIAAFQMRTAVRFLITPLSLGLVGVLLVGLALSLYPDAWRIFRAPARRVWRRDAAVAMVLSLAVGAGLSRLGALVASRFHAYTPVSIALFPDLFDTASPGAGFFLDALLWTPIGVSMVALVVYLARLGWVRRAWWLWVGGALLLVDLGPEQAHSVREFLLGWVMTFVAVTVAAVLVALFFRNNALAYVGAVFCLQLARPLVQLSSQPAAFFLWNGVLLAVLTALALGWMLLATGEPQSSVRASGNTEL